MKRKRHTTEEIVRKLREAATLLASGHGVEEVSAAPAAQAPAARQQRERHAAAGAERINQVWS